MLFLQNMDPRIPAIPQVSTATLEYAAILLNLYFSLAEPHVIPTLNRWAENVIVTYA